MKIEKKLIKYNYSLGNRPIFIVIHDTGNTSAGSGADNHYQYFNSGDRGSSAHYFVDDKKVIQTVEDFNQAWHNGKKYIDNPLVKECNNTNSIGIEICVNQDGDYNKAVNNAIELTKILMKTYHIPPDRVIRHYDSCGKKCPASMFLNPKVWDNFKNIISKKTDEDYDRAVTILVNAGIIGTPTSWQLNNININNVPSLIKKMAKYVEGRA